MLAALCTCRSSSPRLTQKRGCSLGGLQSRTARRCDCTRTSRVSRHKIAPVRLGRLIESRQEVFAVRRKRRDQAVVAAENHYAELLPVRTEKVEGPYRDCE